MTVGDLDGVVELVGGMLHPEEEQVLLQVGELLASSSATDMVTNLISLHQLFTTILGLGGLTRDNLRLAGQLVAVPGG